MALTEAISHLNKGMELVATLPASVERDASELSLRIPLGTAWLAFKGWPATEVWTSFHPALALAKSLGRNDALVPIYWGLRTYVLTVGRVAETLTWAQEMLDTGKATGDADLLITGYMTACNTYMWMGELHATLEQADKVLELYDDKKHRHLVNLLNHDPKTLTGIGSSICTWILGYPDRAVQISDETRAHAQRLGHAFDLGFALVRGSDAFDFRCEADKLHERARECDQLGRDNSLPVLWAFMAPALEAMALIREGNAAEGAAQLKNSLAIWDASGGKCWSPCAKSILAEGLALSGDLDGALQLIDEQIEQVKRPGWEERYYYAEILRLKGWMLTLKDDLEGAEQNYLASLDWAREQQAKSWELRTSTSLARLWQSQGKKKEAHDLLAPVYDWFTEGFDTRDLKEAKALLEELGS
jgi:predicted ATPase